METKLTTREALTALTRALDSIDHTHRRKIAAPERLDLVREARTLARRVDALVSMLVTEADAAHAARTVTGAPTTSWLALSGGTSAGEAAGLVFGGRQIAEVPAVREATLTGKVSVSQARAIVGVLGQLPETLDASQRAAAQDSLIAQAATLPARALTKLGEKVLAEVAPGLLTSPAELAIEGARRRKRALARRRLWFGVESDGSIDFEGSLPLAEASQFRATIEALVESERRDGRDRAHDRRDRLALSRSAEQRRADALIALLAQPPAAIGGGKVSDGGLADGTGAPSARALGGAAAGVDADGAGAPRTGTQAGAQTAGTQAGATDLGSADGPDADGAGVPRTGTQAGAQTAGTQAGAADAGVFDGLVVDGGIADGASAQAGLPHSGFGLARAQSAGAVSAARPQIVVTMTEESLHRRAEQSGLLIDRSELSPGELRRLCCDADLIPVVLGTSSEVLDVGRAARLVTPAIRLALAIRDKHCVFPGCHKPPGSCEAHHVVPWWQGGTTALSNLVLLCPHHHGLIEPLRQHLPPDSTVNGRWEIRFNERRLPEVVPPLRVDPERKPIPHTGPLPPTEREAS